MPEKSFSKEKAYITFISARACFLNHLIACFLNKVIA